MKDYYNELKNYLTKIGFDGPLDKLEKIKDNPIEVIKMYNMYMKQNKLREIIREELDAALDEMARAKVIYTVKDKPSLEKVVDAAKGNTKMALQYLLDKGEMAIADLAKELKKDPAAFNNPGFRKLMADLSDRNVVATSAGASSTPAPKATPTPKMAKVTAPSGDEEDFEKEAPSEKDVAAGEKEFGDIGAEKLAGEEKAKFEKLNTAIKNKVAKLEKMSAKDRAKSPDLAVVKQIINKPEVKKLFKAKGIDVMDLVSSVIS